MNVQYNQNITLTVDNKIYCKYFMSDILKPIVVTFAPLNPISRQEVSKSVSPWGFDFIKNKIGLNVVSFQCIEEDNWYINKSFQKFISELGDKLKVFSERLGYGVSMGGYGVAAYSNLLNLDRVLLVNPISSLDPKLVPFEVRWQQFQKKMDWENALDGSELKAKGYIIYDPIFHLEAGHAKRFESLTQLKAFGAGHSVPAYLVSMGLLQKLFNDFLIGYIDKNQYYKAIKKRRNSKHYYSFMLGKNNTHLSPRRLEVLLFYKKGIAT